MVVAIAAAILPPMLCYGARAAEGVDPERRLFVEKVRFQGLRRYTEAQALAASGLALQQVVRIDDLQAAQGRLLESGLFASIANRHVVTGDRLEVTFLVTEAAWDVPVAFDNFVWFDDADLVAEVAATVPSFDGTAPRTGGVLESIRSSLDALLRDRGIGGRAEHRLSIGSSGAPVEHRFVVVGVDLPLCRVAVLGASAVDPKELDSRTRLLIGTPYSRKSLADSIEANLVPLYGREGHLRAAFAAPKAVPSAAPDCPGGVEASVAVSEGPVYRLGRISWKGNVVFEALELSARLGLQPGGVADTVRLEQGLTAIREDYEALGFFDADASPEARLDDEALTATYTIAVSEGPRYRMGRVTMTGVSAPDLAMLTRLWKLQPGDVFDASYVETFGRQVLERLSGSRKSVKARITRDREAHTVDVALAVE